MIVKFENNVPHTLALKQSQGIEREGNWGPQVMFLLEGGDVMFVSPELAASIRNLNLEPGETFGICKYRNGRKVSWNVWLSPATEQKRAAAETPILASQEDLVPVLQASIEAVRNRKSGLNAYPSV